MTRLAVFPVTGQWPDRVASHEPSQRYSVSRDCPNTTPIPRNVT